MTLFYQDPGQGSIHGVFTVLYEPNKGSNAVGYCSYNTNVMLIFLEYHDHLVKHQVHFYLKNSQIHL